MALGFEKAKCELSRENETLEHLTAPQCSVPVNPSQTQEKHASQVQIMYCKELLYHDETEFSFEELRAQRYYKALREKATYLNKLKQDLQLQIEEKQKVLQQRSSTTAQQIVGEETDSESDSVCETSVPVKIYSDQESDCKSSSRSSVSHEEDTSGGGIDSKLQKMTKPFTVFDENSQSNKILSSSNRKSLKLPTLNLKPSKSKVELSADRDASLSRSEELIVNAHWNKTLCRSPNDTSDFACAAQLASTPFGGAERQKLMENLNPTAPDAPPAPNPDPAPETRKLSPIQEISHDWGGASFAVITQETIRRSDCTEISQAVKTEVLPGDAVEVEDVCSLDGRARLLDQMDMTSFPSFHRKTGRLPQACGEDDLDLDGEKLFYRSKLGGLKNYTLYSSSTGTVILKVDSTSVPWDFFISSKIRSSLSTDEQEVQQISCYVYENGCLTLWRVPHGVIAQDLLTEPVARLDVSLLVLQLLKMVKLIHSCQIVHGGLKPEALYFCHSDVIALDFSCSVDLQLQSDVTSAQLLSSAQNYIEQGLLLPSASPYQVDLVGVAEIVHMLVLNRPLKVMRGNSGWNLDEDSESHQSPVDLVWKNLLHKILNPGEQSTELILSTLISNMRHIL